MMSNISCGSQWWRHILLSVAILVSAITNADSALGDNVSTDSISMLKLDSEQIQLLKGEVPFNPPEIDIIEDRLIDALSVFISMIERNNSRFQRLISNHYEGSWGTITLNNTNLEVPTSPVVKYLTFDMKQLKLNFALIIPEFEFYTNYNSKIYLNGYKWSNYLRVTAQNVEVTCQVNFGIEEHKVNLIGYNLTIHVKSTDHDIETGKDLMLNSMLDVYNWNPFVPKLENVIISSLNDKFFESINEFLSNTTLKELLCSIARNVDRNKYFDKTLSSIVHSLAENEMEPMTLLNYEHSIINFYDGTVTNLKSLHRKDNVTAGCSKKKIRVDFKFAFEDLKLSYQYYYYLLALQKSGKFYGNLKYLVVEAVVSFNMEEYNLQLKTIKTEIGKLSANVTGDDESINYINPFVNTLVEYFTENIKEQAESNVRQKMQTYIDKYNIELKNIFAQNTTSS